MPGDGVVWAIDNLQSIGGHKTTVLGNPMVIDTPQGKAVQFDGVDDALFVDNHPLAGMSQFTVEIFFRPDPGGAQAQRWFHMNENGGGRVLWETRLFATTSSSTASSSRRAGTWPFTTPSSCIRWAPGTTSPPSSTASAPTTYVNGMEESNVALPFVAQGPGQTSIGVRITKMYYFKGPSASPASPPGR
jgi:hypothetical protein